MARKSLSKKSAQSLWSECEKCAFTFASKDCDKHLKFCQLDKNILEHTYPFIREGKLITNKCEALGTAKICIEDVAELPDKQRNSLVFISEGVLRLCKLKIGEQILLSFPNLDDYPPLIRLAWPLEDKYLGQIFFSDEDFELNWKDLKDEKIQVERFAYDPIIVSQISLENKTDDFQDIPDVSHLTNLLQFQMWNRIYAVGSIIAYKYFNKLLKLEITKFEPFIKEGQSLEKEFENLSMKNIFISCTKKTIIRILRESKQEEILDNSINLSEIGGLDDSIETIKENISIALGFKSLGCDIKISRGILLHGPSGCGKSFLAEALANYYSKNFEIEIIKINANEVFSKFFGETELNLKKKFDQAIDNYPAASLILLEDIHSLCPKHETNDIIKRVSVALFNILDNLQLKREASKTFVLATTNNIDNIHPGLRRCGRLDIEIEIPAPNPEARYEILKTKISKVDHNLTDKQIQEISNVTHGFVGSDLSNLIYKSAMHSLSKSDEKQLITIEDINSALNQVKPSAMRQVLIECPNIKWEDIGGQHDLKLKLKQAIEWPLLYPEKFKKLGIKPPRGLLMYGPPGCSKTMIAKALATESRVNFLSIKGPELFSMWVGESERAVREVFRKARQVAPAIIFFDEIDAIGGERSSDGQSSSVKERVLTQLLTELDGIDTLKDVTVVAATNRPDMIDRALLRPGRIDRLVYVGLPDAQTREEILKIKLKKMPISEDVKLEELIKRTDCYSGAEIQAVCHEAALKTLEEDLDANLVCWRHFETSLNLVKPRTSKELLELYAEYMKEK